MEDLVTNGEQVSAVDFRLYCAAVVPTERRFSSPATQSAQRITRHPFRAIRRE